MSCAGAAAPDTAQRTEWHGASCLLDTPSDRAAQGVVGAAMPDSGGPGDSFMRWLGSRKTARRGYARSAVGDAGDYIPISITSAT